LWRQRAAARAQPLAADRDRGEGEVRNRRLRLVAGLLGSAGAAAIAEEVRLLGAADIGRLAESSGLRPSQKRGQNFVIDANTVRRIVRTAGVDPGDVVLEVGPGLGSLTLALLEVAHRVVAVEVDNRLAASLPGTVAEHAPGRADRLQVVHADALQLTEVQLTEASGP